uniref:Uncharacterized protein n=1 Tax=mine drainage metagenome TaxID=410659 RepID=E6QLD8_9ZZZZ
MGVVGDGRVGGGDKQASGHAEVDDPLCVFVGVPGKVADDVFPDAVDALDDAVFKAGGLFAGGGLHWLGVRAEPYLDDLLAVDAVVDSARDGFDLGQLGHGEILALGATSTGARL